MPANPHFEGDERIRTAVSVKSADSRGFLNDRQREAAARLGLTDAEAIALIEARRERDAAAARAVADRRANRPHAIYVAERTDGVVKVGYSVTPHARVETQGALTLLHLRWVENNRQARIAERNAHHELEEHLHEGREWFRVPVVEAIAAVERVSALAPWWLDDDVVSVVAGDAA